MNPTSLPVDTDVPAEIRTRRERPRILEGEDRPLDEVNEEGSGDSAKVIELKEQAHKHKVEDYKNNVGGIILVVCFLIVIIFSAIDACSEKQIDSALFSSAFEFAKTIATAIIGYFFATNTANKNET